MTGPRWNALFASLLLTSIVVGQDEEEEKKEEVKPPRPVATVDIKNSKQGGIPGGTTPKRGKWTVDAESDSLRIGIEPLVEGWLEFGPEIREKPATVKGRARAPGEARIQSRYGIGLYGPNGFQIRLNPARNEMELVRRGEAFKTVSFELSIESNYEMELAVVEDGDDWRLKARVWESGQDRPEDPTVEVVYLQKDLLFPLAGRAVITATPFSGTPVEFLNAEVYEGEFIPVAPEESSEELEESDEGDEEESD